MSVLDFFKKLFPFLVSAAEKEFNRLEDAAKNAGINGSFFAQIIKENTEASIADVEALIKARLPLSDGEAEELFKTIREKYNIPDGEQVVSYLQNKFKNATDDILHSSLANEVASLVAIVLSKGKLSWLTLLAGVGEFIYRKFVKGADVMVVSSNPTDCAGVPQPTTKPTPYGSWECRNNKWIWIEDAG